MIKSTTLARRGFKAVFIQLKSVRSISMQETKVRLERMAEYRKNKEKEPLPPPKTEKLSAMERARDSLAFAIQTKNSEQARLQFDLLKKNLHFLTTTDCLSYLEFLAQSAKLDEITVKNAALLLSHVIERGQKGTTPPQETIYFVLQGLAFLQDGLGLENFVKLVIQNDIQLSVNYVEVLLRYYSRNGPVDSAERLVKYCIDQDIGTTDQFFSLLIDCYGNARMPWKCLNVLKAAEEQGHPITVHLLSRVIRTFGVAREGKGIDLIVELVERKKLTKNGNYYNTLINAYKNTRQVSKGTRQTYKVLQILDEMNEGSKVDPLLIPSVKTLSIMMDMFVKKKYMQAASELLATSIASEMDIDTVMFNTLLHGFRKQGNEEEILYHIQLMENCGLFPDSETYGILLALYGFEKKDLKRANEIYEEMRKVSGWAPNRHMIGTMIAISTVNGDYKAAMRWYETLKERGMTPSSAIICTMIQLTIASSDQSNMLVKGQIYLDIAAQLGLVDQNICRMQAILHIATGSGLCNTLDLYLSQLELYHLKPNALSMYLFSDVISRPLSFIKEQTCGSSSHSIKVDVTEKIEGREWFERLYKKVLEGSKLSVRETAYFDRAKNLLI